MTASHQDVIVITGLGGMGLARRLGSGLPLVGVGKPVRQSPSK
ncbi:hypothetical protein [Cystobacter fuscus]